MSGMNPYGLGGDESNPYAPPRAELRGEAHPLKTLGARVEPFSIESVLSRAWAIYKENMGLVIGIVLGSSLVSGGISFVSNLLPLVIFGPDPQTLAANLLSFALSVGNFLLSMWISAGLAVGIVKIARRQPASFGDVFNGGPYFLATLWGTLILIAVWLGAFLVVMIAALIVGALISQVDMNAILIVVGVAMGVGVLVGVLLSVRLYFYQYAIVDRDLGGFAAIRMSSRVTSGHFFELIILFLVSAAILLAGLLACGVGLIFAGPFVVLISACAYVSLVDEQVARDRPFSDDIMLDAKDFLLD